MTGEPGATGTPRPLAGEGAQGRDDFGLGKLERDALLAWVGENLTLVRRTASGQRVSYWILATAFVIGLAAHVGGFLLKTEVTTEPVSVIADLIYALGWAMSTGVVVVMFVEIWPEVKRRQYKQALDAYEAAVAGQTRPGSGKAPHAEPDLKAEIADTAAEIRELDPLADDYDDTLAVLRAKLKDCQGRLSAEAIDLGASARQHDRDLPRARLADRGELGVEESLLGGVGGQRSGCVVGSRGFGIPAEAA